MTDAFPVVVVIGLAIFGMFWIAGQADGDFDLGIGGSDTPESTLLFSSDPGQIGASNEDFRTVGFGDFTVGEIRGDVQAFTAERAELRNGLFGGKRIIINYNATQPGQGQVNFEVLGRKDKGKIYVKVNGRKVFKAAMISGGTPTINISQENFNSGMNRIVIGTTQSGILSESVYTIEDVEVTVRDRKFHDHTTYFQMYDYELDNFRPSNLTFKIPLDQSIPQKPLRITVNEKTVFKQRVGRSTQAVTITPQNADLSTGYNTIEFGTEGESKYTINNAELQVRYSIKTRPASRNYKFDLTEDRLEYVEQENTEETLRFQYQKSTTAEPIQISVNDAFYQIEPENGLNRLELEEGIFKRENTLRIDSNQTFTMENLNLVSEKQDS